MTRLSYLMIGGGMTADAAGRAVRAVDPGGAVGMISAEPHAPYARPPLSKGLWKGDAEAGIWRGTETAGVELRLGRRGTGIDRKGKTVTDDRGDVVGYGKLLIATCGTPRPLPLDTDQIIYFRRFADIRPPGATAHDALPFAGWGGGVSV